MSGAEGGAFSNEENSVLRELVVVLNRELEDCRLPAGGSNFGGRPMGRSKAAPFKRNDAMLGTLPIGVMVFPGAGIQENLADKAKKFGIPVWKFGGA